MYTAEAKATRMTALMNGSLDFCLKLMARATRSTILVVALILEMTSLENGFSSSVNLEIRTVGSSIQSTDGMFNNR